MRFDKKQQNSVKQLFFNKKFFLKIVCNKNKSTSKFDLPRVMFFTQSCLTLCDLMDCSPPGSSAWNSPDRNTEVGSHSLR